VLQSDDGTDSPAFFGTIQILTFCAKVPNPTKDSNKMAMDCASCDKAPTPAVRCECVPRVVDGHRLIISTRALQGKVSPFDLTISSSVTLEQYHKQGRSLGDITPMSLWEDFAVVAFFIAIVGATVVPPVAALYSVYSGNWFFAVLFAGITVTLITAPLHHAYPPMGTLSAINELLSKYFSLKVVWDEHLLEQNQNYIFVAPPHGLIPFGNILMLMFSRLMFGFSFYGLTASNVLKIPVVRHFMGMLGCVDASRKTAIRLLEEKKNVGIATGGIAEMFENGFQSKNETIVLRNRKGFVRLAFETGTPIICLYNFGNTAAMSAITDPWGIAQALSRKIKLALTMGFGRFGLPVPFRVPIVVIVSEPIPVPKKANPTEEEVEEMLGNVIKTLEDMFEKHKHSYGWGYKKLVVK
jgi:1-acyl-sn-glycerol-3-phosphate acyltransferase